MREVRVLIVDDQAIFRRAMAAVVEATDGFVAVGEVDSGEASIEASTRLVPDLVLMDVNLPGIDGLEATRRIRSGPHTPVVVLVSSYGEDEGQQFVTDCGAAGYVTKSAFGTTSLTQAWSAATTDSS